MNNLLLILFLSLFSAHSFSQTENFWTKKSNYGTDTIVDGLKRDRAVGFSIGDCGYIGTGIDTAEVVRNDFWKYDPVLNSWSQIATLPGSVRRNALAFSIGNKGYVGTGINTVNSGDIGSTTLNDFWEYNPATNAWIQKANYPGSFSAGIYFATGFSIDSKGYVCGGKIGPNNYSNELWEYKPSINQWTQLPNFPGGVRYKMSSFSIGFKGYVGLGADQDLYNNDFWEFNAATNQWTEIAPLPASERADAATFSLNQRGYVCMGTNGGLLDDLWEYTPENDEWTVRANYGGSRRKGSVGFSIHEKGYVGTGKGYSGKKSTFYEYTPAAYVGIDEIENEFAVYPNPVRSELNITNSSGRIESIKLYTSSGQLALASEMSSKIDVATLNKGIYFLVGIGGNGEKLATQKIIKQ